MARCSICYTLIQPTDPTHPCPECQQQYHETCWSEIGGCGTYGCKSAAVAQKPPVPVLVGSGWGDSKDCPVCHKAISASLLICRVCNSTFPWAEPMTPEEYADWRAGEQQVASAKKILVTLFLFSIAGVTAPLAGPAAGLYAYRKRGLLAGAHGTFLALGVGSAALGACYLVLILLLALGK
jgi:hypothetical protein